MIQYKGVNTDHSRNILYKQWFNTLIKVVALFISDI